MGKVVIRTCERKEENAPLSLLLSHFRSFVSLPGSHGAQHGQLFLGASIRDNPGSREGSGRKRSQGCKSRARDEHDPKGVLVCRDYVVWNQWKRP
jgi:hypothetical protein